MTLGLFAGQNMCHELKRLVGQSEHNGLSGTFDNDLIFDLDLDRAPSPHDHQWIPVAK